ncbi:T9SS type A sorting domain-containing protein [Flavobacterium sp. F372]|uniref:T9SS type A sorting domain-containing protein n=1 Tax=Flavobacterium bernardetii TaxID=2813823 RepID=A0ABR7IYM9_9FLAO|nr:YCF48-related protein [Flavobacterium bernardetii]MBC5834818.1 T9SS type A sorting domain-containing protein [Flavobacterium bernardetii]NHF70629.1 T9SS type A sorting domain-containing protein [Flavobacterium bernardetii]
MKKITLGLITLFSLPTLAQWTVVPSGTTGEIDAIHFVDSQLGYCGGGFVNLRKTTNGGASWTTLSTQKIRDFSFVDNTFGYSASVVGTSMAKTIDGGNTWANFTPPTSNSLWAVSATNSTTAYFVGTGGVLWKTSNGGTSVTVLNSGTTEQLNDIVFISPTIGMIIGESTGIRRTTNSGVSWSVVNATTSLTEMCFVNTNVGYAVGSNGKIVKTIDGGLTWTLLVTNSTAHLQGVHFFDINNGLAVGLSGKILFTNDGGVTWNLQNSGLTSHLRDVRMLSASKAIVVGDSGKILKNDNITILGTEEFGIDNEISIYPNPTSSIVNIKSGYNINSIVISDITGNVVFESKNTNNTDLILDINNYASGIYFANISNEKGNIIKKIIKM